MNELDHLLSKAIIHAIKAELKDEMIKKIEDEGIKIDDLLSISDKAKAYLFETEFEALEDHVLRDFLSVEEHSQTKEKWLTIKNRELTEKILKTFADPEKKAILDLTNEGSETIPKILVLCNLPNTTGYRKMKQLIEDGFVTSVGMAETFEGKRALIYRSIIQKIQISIKKNEIIAKILVPKDILSSSYIVSSIMEEERKDTHTN